MTTAIYARYSSELQSERSIEDQVAACEAFARQRGLFPPFRVFMDAALSGASMATRPGVLALVQAMRERSVVVVVSESIDRLSRDQADIHAIRRVATTNDVKLVTIADGEVTSMIAGLKGIMAEAYLIDLADKTRRGMKGVARSGRIAGGRCYGYRLIPGKPGEREIDAAQAEIVREIFTRYAEGHSSFSIVRDLNGRREAGPTGRPWTVNGLTGDPRSGDGVLCQPLYRGEIVFNRRRFIKDPETGRRRSVLNPEHEWTRTPAEHLRIVSDDLWAAAQARRRVVREAVQNQKRQPARVFSGLIRCAACQGAMVIENRGRLVCANLHGGTQMCDVRQRVPVALVERRVIAGIQRCLLAPNAIAEAVATFNAARATRRKGAVAARARLENDVAAQARKVERIVDQLLDLPSAALKQRLMDAEAELARLRAALADAEAHAAADTVVAHPNASEAYRAKVAALGMALDAGAPDPIKAAVRGLVSKITLAPVADAPDGWEIIVHGQLAAMLALGAQHAAAQTKTPDVAAGGSADPCRSDVGAGAHTGIEPTWRVANDGYAMVA